MQIEDIAQENEPILHQNEEDKMHEESHSISSEKHEDRACVSKESLPVALVT